MSSRFTGWRFWGRECGRSVYASILFALSTRYNVCRLENSSYATWNTILSQLCSKDPSLFLICPQYGLYVSPRDPTDEDTSIASFATAADSKARGVYVDNTIILPTFDLREAENVSTVKAYFDSMLGEQPHIVERGLRVRRAIVPVLVEEKRPPPRHCTIARYTARVKEFLDEAKEQAEGQAECLFSMKKFGHQQDVILIAASGGWWATCLISRKDDEVEVFNIERYVQATWWNNFVNAMADKDDASDDPQSAFYSQKKAAEDLQDETEEGEGAEGADGNDDDDDYDDNDNYHNNNNYDDDDDDDDDDEHNNEHNEHNEEELDDQDPQNQWVEDVELMQDIIKRTGKGPFSMGDMDDFWVAKTGERFCQPNQAVVEIPRGDWTAAMRLGTEVSGRHLSCIQDHLQRLAREERGKREARSRG
ncbi:hypothetical protein ONZ45_g8348 [Pleurotus djamor]|nr:hypothetical protein ONZ45_g8348 [Pleurotus djamor]